MPKGIRKSKDRGGHQFSGHNVDAELTVYHFANADPSSAKTGRMSKGVNTWSSPAKKLTGTSAKAEDALHWYEKDLSEFDLLSDSESLSEVDTEDENEPNDEEPVAVVTKPSGGSRRKERPEAQSEEDDGVVYPLDVWFMIGQWVDPEDVVTFALTCRSSHVVTHSARFWYRLYERCYNSKAMLPATLQPQSMERVHGLRDRVVRAIYIMYPPFQHRLHSRAPFEKDPDCLKGACCTLMWYQNSSTKSHWNFYFKFLLPRNDKYSCPLRRRPNKCSKKLNPLLQAPDIHHNPETSSCVLQAVTQNFIPLAPSIMGQVLAQTSLSVSHGMRYHKLKLTFTPQQYRPQNGSSSIVSGTTIVLDPVVNSFILNWWDPRYPHQPV